MLNSRFITALTVGIVGMVLAYGFGRLREPVSAESGLHLTIDARDLQNGDIIFRQTNTIASRYIRSFEDDAPYSHTGIIVIENDNLSVIHAMPPNGDYAGVTVSEPLDRFMQQTTAVAVYRVASTPEQVSAAVWSAKQHVDDQTPFDMQFDLASNTALYCTELIWLVWKNVGIDLVAARFDTLDMPFATGDYILPNSLTKSPYLTLVVAKQTAQAGE